MLEMYWVVLTLTSVIDHKRCMFMFEMYWVVLTPMELLPLLVVFKLLSVTLIYLEGEVLRVIILKHG